MCNLPTSLSGWLSSTVLGERDRTLVVCIVAARVSLVEVGTVAVPIELPVVLRDVDCMLLLVVVVATGESTVAV